jgi:hypothetical protein
MQALLNQALALGAKQNYFVFVNSLGNVFKVSGFCAGTYGATVYRLYNGTLVRQFGL